MSIEVREVPFVGGPVDGRIYKDDGFGFGRDVVVPTYSDNPHFNNPEPTPGRLVYGLYLRKEDTPHVDRGVDVTLTFLLQLVSLALLILMLRQHHVESKRRDKMLAEQAQRISALIDDIRQREGL